MIEAAWRGRICEYYYRYSKDICFPIAVDKSLPWIEEAMVPAVRVTNGVVYVPRNVYAWGRLDFFESIIEREVEVYLDRTSSPRKDSLMTTVNVINCSQPHLTLGNYCTGSWFLDARGELFRKEAQASGGTWYTCISATNAAWRTFPADMLVTPVKRLDITVET